MYLADKVDRLTANTYYFAITKQAGTDNILPWYISMFLDLDDGLTHVLILTHLGENKTILYDYLHSGLVTHVIDEHADFVAAKLKRGGCEKVVKLIYNKQIRNISHAIPNCVPGCVTFAKILIGSKDWIFTPTQFYNWLMANGAVEFSYDDATNILMEKLLGEDDLG